MEQGETPPDQEEVAGREEAYPLMNEGESLDDYFLRVGEQVPAVKIELYSAAHMNYEDASGIREMMPNADIFIPEGMSWTQANIDRKNAISLGEHDETLVRARAAGIESADFMRASEDVLSGTGIPVVSVDVPHRELSEQEKRIKFKPDRDDRLPYEESLQIFIAGRERFAAEQLEREKYMREHLGPKILEALSIKPELRQKGEITVLMPLGAAHTDIYHKLKNSGTNIKRTFQTSPYIYPYETEYQHRLAFDSDTDAEFIERSFIESIIFKGLPGVSKKHETPEGQLFKRTLVGLLDANERREYYAMYQELRRNYLLELDEKRKQFKSEFGEHWQQPHREQAAENVDKELEHGIEYALREVFQKKGIELPKSEDEEIEFLRTHAPMEIAYINQVKQRQEEIKETE